MELINAWVIYLLGLSLPGNAYGQGLCTICDKITRDADCKQKYDSPVTVDGKMCRALISNKNHETHVCTDYPNGYKIICELDRFEFSCLNDCPKPTTMTVYDEDWQFQPGDTGVSLRSGHSGVMVIGAFLVTLLSFQL